MKKFEIVNNKWIKLFDKQYEGNYTILKIDSVSVVKFNTDANGHGIIFKVVGGGYNSQNYFVIEYSNDETLAYKNDQLFFESLLFDQFL